MFIGFDPMGRYLSVSLEKVVRRPARVNETEISGFRSEPSADNPNIMEQGINNNEEIGALKCCVAVCTPLAFYLFVGLAVGVAFTASLALIGALLLQAARPDDVGYQDQKAIGYAALLGGATAAIPFDIFSACVLKFTNPALQIMKYIHSLRAIVFATGSIVLGAYMLKEWIGCDTATSLTEAAYVGLIGGVIQATLMLCCCYPMLDLIKSPSFRLVEQAPENSTTNSNYFRV